MKRMIVFFLVLLSTCAVIAQSGAAKPWAQYVAELENKLAGAEGAVKVDTLNELCLQFTFKQPDRAIQFGDQALELAAKIGYRLGEAVACKRLAYVQAGLGDYEQAIVFSRKASELFRETGDNGKTWRSLLTLSQNCRRNGDFDEALKCILDALKLSRRLNDKKQIAETYYQLGVFYSIADEDPENKRALEYYQKALKTGEEAGAARRVIYYINNLGLVYLDTKQYNEALRYFRRALALATQQGDLRRIGGALLNSAIAYNNLGNYDKAVDCLLKAMEKYRENELGSGLNLVYLQLGRAYSGKKNYPKAVAYFDKASNNFRERNEKKMLEMTYREYATTYAAAGDYKNAFEYHQRYTGIKDELINEAKNKEIARLQERYDAEKRAREIEILENTAKIQAITRNALTAGLILVVILLGFIIKKYLYLFAFWKKQKYIGQYRLLESIGSGGMGHVYKAHNIRDKTSVVAIKVLKDELFKVESNRVRFKQEGAIIDKLNHPNVLKIFERGVHEERLYFAMEYIEGRTLEKKIEETGQIPLDQCLHIMSQITGALAVIHGRNIVHRDLKPANIMLTEKDGDADFVKLLDFGLSKMRHQTRITESGFLVGTINYLAPEQIVDFEYSPASDMYSLGIIFYEMVIGDIAFAGESVATVIENILDTAPPPPNAFRSDIPDELNRLIVQMISKKNDQRPTAPEVLSTLKELSLSGSP